MSNELTPKRAAELLVYEWLNGGRNPFGMDAEEMTIQLDQYNYNVTDRRREQVIEQMDNIVNPLKEKLAEKVQRFTNI